jgi:hypothetical protein
MLLKGRLSRTEPASGFKKKYGHNLIKIWAAFKALFPQEDLSGFDDVIGKLAPFFDGLRYPDKTLSSGAVISVCWVEVFKDCLAVHGNPFGWGVGNAGGRNEPTTEAASLK